MTDYLKVLTAAALALGLSACSGADVVTEGQDEIAISVEDEDDLGSATVVSEIMALRHETQHSRLFRS